jgi:hypothetical protein
VDLDSVDVSPFVVMFVRLTSRQMLVSHRLLPRLQQEISKREAHISGTIAVQVLPAIFTCQGSSSDTMSRRIA